MARQEGLIEQVVQQCVVRRGAVGVGARLAQGRAEPLHVDHVLVRRLLQQRVQRHEQTRARQTCRRGENTHTHGLLAIDIGGGGNRQLLSVEKSQGWSHSLPNRKVMDRIQTNNPRVLLRTMLGSKFL